MAAALGLDQTQIIQLVLGVVLGTIVALGARQTATLTTGGAIAAAMVGTLTFGAGGLVPSILLLTFFISSSLLSRRGVERKQAIAGRASKSGTRDAWQVAANGAVPALLAVGYGTSGQELWMVGVAGALAASNADTWATEIGVLSSVRPRMITSLQPVEAGTSGAISGLGSLAALAGALLIGIAASLLEREASLLYLVGAGGLTASFLDSLMGATIQARYRCPSCDHLTESHPAHTCGTPTVLVGGLSWMGNDQVNLAASALGALVTTGLWIVLS